MKRKTADKKGQKKTRPNVTAGVRRSRLLIFLIAGFTRATAARAVGISTRTLDRITADPIFRLELAAARSAAFTDTLEGLKGASSRAVETLARLLTSKREGTRRQAASEILSFAMRAHDTGEIEARIAALEKKAAEIRSDAGGVN